MQRRWQLDDQHLIAPTGRRIALKDIEDWAMAAWGGNQRIATDKWRGWRVVQQYLVPPGRTLRTCAIHINAIRSIAFDVERSRREDLKKRVSVDEVTA